MAETLRRIADSLRPVRQEDRDIIPGRSGAEEGAHAVEQRYQQRLFVPSRQGRVGDRLDIP